MWRVGSHWPKGIKPKRNIPRAKYARWGVIDPRAIVSLKTPEIVRGKYRIRTVTDDDMIKRYAGFKVQIIGVESRTEPPIPSGPFLSRRGVEDEQGKRGNFISFDAARITHKDSPITIDIHWHPSHKRLVTVRGFSKVVTTPDELAVITTALSFDKKEKRRGAPPKVNRAAVIAAIREQGEKATQKSVAAATGMTPHTLRDWLYFSEGATWPLLKREVISGESW
jgi:hypothetical protein